MKSVRVFTPANAMRVGRRIGAAMRSLPTPQIDTRLVAEALRHAGSRIEQALRGARAATPQRPIAPEASTLSPIERLQVFRHLAQLCTEETHAGFRQLGRELAEQLQPYEEVEGLPVKPAESALETVRKMVKLAAKTMEKEHHAHVHGHNVRLAARMGELTGLGNRLEQDLASCDSRGAV